MKIKILHKGNGEVERTEIPEEGDLSLEERFNYSDEIEPLTMEQRRAAINHADSEKRRRDAEIRENWLTALRHGAEILDEGVRSQAVGTPSAGGYLAPASFSAQLYEMMGAADALFSPDAVSIVDSARGTAMAVP